MNDIARRKLDHLELALSGDVAHATPTGFDRYYFLHEALPELAPEDVDLSTTFLGRRLGAPFIVAAMTGGPERGAQKRQVTSAPLSVASMSASSRSSMSLRLLVTRSLLHSQ